MRQVVDLQEVEREGRGPDLEHLREGQDVRVAMQEMEPAVTAGIGQRFVPRVDDGPVELHPFEEIVVDVVRPLADLEEIGFPRPGQIAPRLRRHGRAHPARPAEQHAHSEEGQQRQDVSLGQLGRTSDEVVLVAAERRARIVVDVVPDEADLAGHSQLLDRLADHGVAGLVVTEHVKEREAFGRAELKMAHVDVGPAAIEQKASVARRFVPIALMDVDESVTLLREDPVTHPADGPGRSRKTGSQAAVFRFKADDAVHASITWEQFNHQLSKPQPGGGQRFIPRRALSTTVQPAEFDGLPNDARPPTGFEFDPGSGQRLVVRKAKPDLQKRPSRVGHRGLRCDERVEMRGGPRFEIGIARGHRHTTGLDLECAVVTETNELVAFGGIGQLGEDEFHQERRLEDLFEASLQLRPESEPDQPT